MEGWIYYFLLTSLLGGLITNTDPHQTFIDLENQSIGRQMNPNNMSLKNPDAGKVSSNGVIKQGEGVTHITKDKNGNDVYHFFSYERLKNPSIFGFFEQKGLIGKCLTYAVVDPKTNIIIDWGFDKGGNPKTCRVTG